MSAPENDPEIWFERWGPEWSEQYMPITMKGFGVMMAHFAPFLLVGVPAAALLERFTSIRDEYILAVAMAGVVASIFWFCRTAHRHSLPQSKSPKP